MTKRVQPPTIPLCSSAGVLIVQHQPLGVFVREHLHGELRLVVAAHNPLWWYIFKQHCSHVVDVTGRLTGGGGRQVGRQVDRQAGRKHKSHKQRGTKERK